MRADEPEICLRYDEGGEARVIPFPRFYLPDDRAFLEFCRSAGDTLWFEREADGEVRLLPASGAEAGRRKVKVLSRLATWNAESGEPGYVFNKSAGFLLSNGAVRAPDIAYVEKARYDALTDDQREHHAPLAPDFVIEVMSPSDRLPNLQAKMEEYRDNGVRLGWLVDRKSRAVYVYRPGRDAETLADPPQISADPELPGFALALGTVW
jgi:Uma2 family endonuclease